MSYFSYILTLMHVSVLTYHFVFFPSVSSSWRCARPMRRGCD